MNQQAKNRHERRRLETCRKLQEATLALILERGYDMLSVQDITERADVGRGTFYIHFKDKEDAAWSVIREGFEATDREAHRVLTESFEGRMPPQPEYFGYVNMFRLAEQNRDLYRMMLGGQGSALLTARAQDYIAADLEREALFWPIYEGYEAPRQVVAQIVTGAIVRLITWWLETDNDYSAEQMAAMLYETLHHRKP
jgi:AcrR family transcriptional regulator